MGQLLQGDKDAIISVTKSLGNLVGSALGVDLISVASAGYDLYNAIAHPKKKSWWQRLGSVLKSAIGPVIAITVGAILTPL